MTNNNNFTINTDQDTVTIPPKSQAKINIVFNPSSIGSGSEQQQHQTNISFVNEKVCTIRKKYKKKKKKRRNFILIIDAIK